ncbi:hypothetical protein MMC28_002995 [Mycoblastus sanguinarius]|nr:hypothetical protein [Mycoblastus sanguinarius]
MAGEIDPFDSVLTLEDDFYKDGYDLGVSDGDRAGRIEGRLFGLEKGFEKYAAIGKLHGRAVIWAGRLPASEGNQAVNSGETEEADTRHTFEKQRLAQTGEEEASRGSVPLLPSNKRLATHIRSLFALAESSSLSTENNEESVSEFDDRLKRAEGKVKIIEKLTGEIHPFEATSDQKFNRYGALPKDMPKKKDDSSIEDTNILHARH